MANDMSRNRMCDANASKAVTKHVIKYLNNM